MMMLNRFYIKEKYFYTERSGVMTYQTKKAIVSLVANVAVFFILLFGLEVFASGDSQLWGKFFLALLGMMIATNVLVTFTFIIVNNAIGQYAAPKKQDERDRAIELKSVRNFCFLLSFGFFVSMALLALGRPTTAMFTTMAATVLAASIGLYTSYIF